MRLPVKVEILDREATETLERVASSARTIGLALFFVGLALVYVAGTLRLVVRQGQPK